MNLKTWAAVILTLSALTALMGNGVPHDDLPSFQGAALLVGTPPFFLVLTSPRGDMRLQPEQNQPETRQGAPIYPSISRDGKIIAYARLKRGMPERVVAVSTFSVITDKHSDYSEGEYSGSIAISPDGSKLAFSARVFDRAGDPRMHIVDLRTGKETLGPEIGNSPNVFASWSPDSRRLVYDVHLGYDRDDEIRVWDSDTGRVSKIADGEFPAWSPSGEWIAYLHHAQGTATMPSGQQAPYLMLDRSLPRCFLIHPDGTSKSAIDLHLQAKPPRFLVESPVWSPDSQTILLNELTNVDTGTVDVQLLDLKTQKTRTAFRDSLRILGWADAK